MLYPGSYDLNQFRVMNINFLTRLPNINFIIVQKKLNLALICNWQYVFPTRMSHRYTNKLMTLCLKPQLK